MINRATAGERPQQWNSTDRTGVLIAGVHAGQPFRIYFLPRDWIGVRKWRKEGYGGVYWEGVLLGNDYKTITEANDRPVTESVEKLGMSTPSLVNGGWSTAQELFRGRLRQVEKDSRAMMERFCQTDEDRVEAVHSLIVAGVPAEGLIREFAVKGTGRTREFCITALCHIGGPEAVRILEQSLTDPTVSEQGKKYAVMGLERIADPKSGPAVLAALEHYDRRDARTSAGIELLPAAAAMLARVHYQQAAPKCSTG